MCRVTYTTGEVMDMYEEKHCDMCAHYRMDDEYTGKCKKYHEIHYPTDGKGCPGWKYWEDEKKDETG